MVYSTRRFVVCFSVCHFVLVFFGPFGVAIASLGEERAGWCICTCLDLSVSSSSVVWEGLRFVIVALPGLFSYLFFSMENSRRKNRTACTSPVSCLRLLVSD